MANSKNYEILAFLRRMLRKKHTKKRLGGPFSLHYNQFFPKTVPLKLFNDFLRAQGEALLEKTFEVSNLAAGMQDIRQILGEY